MNHIWATACCFSTATVVAQSCHCVAFYAHRVSCVFPVLQVTLLGLLVSIQESDLFFFFKNMVSIEQFWRKAKRRVTQLTYSIKQCISFRFGSCMLACTLDIMFAVSPVRLDQTGMRLVKRVIWPVAVCQCKASWNSVVNVVNLVSIKKTVSVHMQHFLQKKQTS